MKRLLVLLCMVALLLATGGVASANTVASSTMWFEGTLTEVTSGVYTGTIAMVDEFVSDIGDKISGFDVYARNGAIAMYDKAGAGTQDYAHGAVTEHDAYTTAGGWGTFSSPDCADWDNYQLKLTDTSWHLEYNGNVGNDGILTGASASPMSGAMNWANKYASEDDVGAYYTGMGTPEAPGFAVTNLWNTGGAGYWDMDWSWGSESIPLQFAGFKIDINCLGGDKYRVEMTPVPIPPGILLLASGLLGMFGIRRFKFRK